MDNNEQLNKFREVVGQSPGMSARENQEMMNTILDNATISITLMDYQGRFTFFNQQAINNLRLPPELLSSKTITELFPEEGPKTLEVIRQISMIKSRSYMRYLIILGENSIILKQTGFPCLTKKGMSIM